MIGILLSLPVNFQGHRRLVKQIRVALAASFNIRHPGGGHESRDTSSRGAPSAKLGSESMAAGQGTFARDPQQAESLARNSLNDHG